MSETDLVHAIIKALNRLPHTHAFRNNTGKRGGVHYGLCVGSSDVIAWCIGRFFAIEVKGPAGKLTDSQRDFLRDVNRCGGYGCWVTSLEEAIAHWRACYAKLKAPVIE